MSKNALINRFAIITSMLVLIMVIAFCAPLRIHADTTDKFNIKISYDVDETNDESTNYIKVYYWTPTEFGYDYQGAYTMFTQVAKYKGPYVKEAALPGPPQCIEDRKSVV